MSGRVKKAVIRRIAETRRIPLAAAAHAYACMSIARKNALCEREASKASAPPTQKDPSHG